MIDEFKDHVKTYKDNVKSTLEKVLQKVPLFKNIPHSDIFKIIFSFEIQSIAPG